MGGKLLKSIVIFSEIKDISIKQKQATSKKLVSEHSKKDVKN